jgi:hypothetical protein
MIDHDGAARMRAWPGVTAVHDHLAAWSDRRLRILTG